MTRESLRERNDPPGEGYDPPAQTEPASAHAPEAVHSLRQAMRRARFDDAERIGVMADQREAKIGRLEILQDALGPLLDQIPKAIDLFDVGIMPGSTPRLFIDMIGFVEMGRDAHLYRFIQDTRHSRLVIAESADPARMVAAVTDYVARRLLERERALASDALDADYPEAPMPVATRPAATKRVRPEPPPRTARPRPRGFRRVARWGGLVFAFIIDLLGAIAFFTILAAAGWLLWTRLHGQV